MFEQIINFITTPSFLETAQQFLLAVTSIVTAASALTALTPTKNDDKIRDYLLAVLNFLALNIGNACKKDKGDV
ncbi:MAG: hypothetical protein CO093_01275 [Alphaproteobacteria bacterium CG_4_9_14_3_um_filter_47_13]|nr:MAG: hypothetical protein CO093_01275 [Alphaproteobacteria bacterium CG_4_9_14_3_um_filter_47_13]